jgi:flavin-dependent dehydrogenase
MVVGDAAGLTDPLTSEGIKYAMFSGEIAGKIAAEAISKGDFSERFLLEYEKQWKGKFGRWLKIMKKGRDLFEKCTNKDLDFLIGSLQAIGFPHAFKKIYESEGYDILSIMKNILFSCENLKALIKLSRWGLRKVF